MKFENRDPKEVLAEAAQKEMSVVVGIGVRYDEETGQAYPFTFTNSYNTVEVIGLLEVAKSFFSEAIHHATDS